MMCYVCRNSAAKAHKNTWILFSNTSIREVDHEEIAQECQKEERLRAFGEEAQEVRRQA